MADFLPTRARANSGEDLPRQSSSPLKNRSGGFSTIAATDPKTQQVVEKARSASSTAC
jgi:hypothetical protein